MHWRGFEKLVDWSLGLFLSGSVLLSIGDYVWQLLAEERHHKEILTTMSTVFQFDLSSKTEVVHDEDNYSFHLLPTPAATDGDSGIVVRVPGDEINAVIRSMSTVSGGQDHLRTEAFPPWKSLYKYFGKEMGRRDCVHKFIVHDRCAGDEISNCKLLIVNRENRMPGYFRWDQ